MTDSGLKAKSDAGDPSFARTTSRQSPQLDRQAPRVTDALGEQEAPGALPSRWRRPLLIAGPVALIAGALGLYLATGRYVTEEDSYVQAVNVSISPQVAGQVVAIAARSNTPVKRDNPLFNLDPEPYRIALANAEAQLGIARDQVRNLIETYRSRLKQIDEAKATVDYAQTNYDRQQHLFDAARLDDIPEPPLSDGAVLVRTMALGVCGTDREIISGSYGCAPPGQQRLVLGHESLGEIKAAPAESGLAPGDLIVGIVRRPDPVPCPACAMGEWDMCRNGRYTERGIKERHGYGVERFRIEPEFAVKIDPTLGLLGVLLEPASILAKAWDHIERIGRRAQVWTPKTLLVTGAGPVGLLAGLMGVQRGLDVHVLDHNEEGPKPALARELGATYHSDGGDMARLQPDIVMECTGAPSIIRDCLGVTAPAGILCLAGVTAPGNKFDLDIGSLNRIMVRDNDVVFGTVNANRWHYKMAADALARADKAWLGRLITRRVPLDRWSEALEYRHGDIKVIIDFVQ